MNEFKESVLKGNFRRAYDLYSNMPRKEVEKDLVDISFDSKNMLAYGFIVFSLLKEETVKLHSIAAHLLTSSYSSMDDSANLAYCHAKRALEIEPNSILALSSIMFLSGDPDTNGTKEEFEFAKARMSELCPNDPILKLNYKDSMPSADWEKSILSRLYEQ